MGSLGYTFLEVCSRKVFDPSRRGRGQVGTVLPLKSLLRGRDVGGLGDYLPGQVEV